MDVKETLQKFAAVIDTKLMTWWGGEIDKGFGYNSKQQELVRDILSHAREHNSHAGKRLRSALVYYTFKIGSKPVSDSLWNAAMSVELVHTALLMHDDFMDEDVLRRGKPTTQIVYERVGGKHYGESMAVQIGATVLTLGYKLLLTSGFPPQLSQKATSLLLEHIVETGYGQMFDISLPFLGTWTEEDVIALHTAKTAIYTYQNPIFIGALLAELPTELLPILEKYAHHAGVAFQIQDDILGVFGETESTGKSSDSDLLQGKATLLALKTIELASPTQLTAFKKVWGKKKASKSAIGQAKDAIKKSGALQYNIDFSKREAQKAVEELANLKKMGFNGEGTDFLEGIATYMVNREV